jgi:hypothetical protein
MKDTIQFNLLKILKTMSASALTAIANRIYFKTAIIAKNLADWLVQPL